MLQCCCVPYCIVALLLYQHFTVAFVIVNVAVLQCQRFIINVLSPLYVTGPAKKLGKSAQIEVFRKGWFVDLYDKQLSSNSVYVFIKF